MTSAEAPEGGDVADALAVAALDEATVRRWLTLLGQPDRLAGPGESALLRVRGRLPAVTSASSVGHALRDLIVQTIERLRPAAGAPRQQELPYLVLKTCFVDGTKRLSAADRLGISPRQLTRERARAIKLLHAELTEAPPAEVRAYRPEQIPAIAGYLPRPGVTRALTELLAEHRLVHVHGPKGIGKTSLVADIAAEAARRTPVFWYRFRAGVNTTLGALSFELGEHLSALGRGALAAYLAEALPAPDLGIVSRLALRDLADVPQLLVLDDEHLAEPDPAIHGFVEEAVLRLPELRVLMVGRGRRAMPTVGAAYSMPPLTRIETQTLLGQLGVRASPVMADSIHGWTEGLPHLVTLGAAWLKSASEREVAAGMAALSQEEAVQDFLLDAVSDVLDSADRALLDAASVFRDRFSDDALAYVADQTLGTVADASRRLVRRHVASRSRDGDVAFFHGSIREYFAARLGPARRRELHQRAAEWYAAHDCPGEAAHHRTQAGP